MNYRDLWTLEGQVFIVVGAGGGMGLESARALAELGANLVLVELQPELAEKAAAEVGGIAVPADATEEAGLSAAIDRATSEFGRIDGAVDVVGGASRS